MTGGYDQVDATVAAYVDAAGECGNLRTKGSPSSPQMFFLLTNYAISILFPDFAKLPDKPPSPLLASGQCVDLVSYTEGTVKETPGYDLIRNLPSFVCLETHIKQGSKVKKTVDISTDCGSLVVVNSDEEALARDIEIIRLIEKANAMFVFYPEEEVEWVERREQMMLKAKSLDWRMNASKPNAAVAKANKRAHRRVFSQNLTEWPSNLMHQHVGEWKL